jgi:hypothetical protein
MIMDVDSLIFNLMRLRKFIVQLLRIVIQKQWI